MADRDDRTEKFVLFWLAGLVLLVAAGILGFGVQRALTGGEVSDSSGAMAAAATDAASEVLYFELGQDQLPVDASPALARVAETVRGTPGALVLISGFHDTSGDAAMNAELAKRRAQRVFHALEALGVSPSQMVMDKPAETVGGDDPRLARRVELRLR